MLDQLTKESFENCKSNRFILEVGDGTKIPLVIKKVKHLRESPAEGLRNQFAVVFKGGKDVLPQQVYSLQNEELGALDVFLVPMGREDDKENGDVLYNCMFA